MTTVLAHSENLYSTVLHRVLSFGQLPKFRQKAHNLQRPAAGSGQRAAAGDTLVYWSEQVHG
jgi:hypothetical protein